MLSPAQRLAAAAGFLLAVAGTCLGFYFVTRSHSPGDSSGPLHGPVVAKPRPECPTLVLNPQGPSPRIFEGKPAPEVVIMVSGQMHGYLQPCGCARPQKGGLERRHEVLKLLRSKGWAVAAVDLGELAPEQADEQGRIKFETALHSLKLMDYAAVGIGLTEMTLPLDQALGIAINYQPTEMLAANLNDKELRFPEMFRGWKIQEAQAAGKNAPPVRIGFVGLVGPTVAARARERDPTLVFDPIDQALPAALRELDAKHPALRVLLYQGSKAEARKLAEQFPVFNVIVAQDDTDEPSGVPEIVGQTRIVALGHKGKYVGLVGFFRSPDGKQLETEYQLVPVSEHFELPEHETNPSREELRSYVLRIQRDDFLGKTPQRTHPLQLDFPDAQFVGAEKCKDCHKSAYAVWSTSGHSKAYEHLVKCGRPLAKRERKGEPPLLVGRQFDPDCVKCHTTGFGYKTGFVNEKTTPYLLGNQCENCHGPGSLHVANPKDTKYSAPLRLQVGQGLEFNVCRKCHDADNDPKFNFELYWPKIRHGKD